MLRLAVSSNLTPHFLVILPTDSDVGALEAALARQQRALFSLEAEAEAAAVEPSLLPPPAGCLAMATRLFGAAALTPGRPVPPPRLQLLSTSLPPAAPGTHPLRLVALPAGTPLRGAQACCRGRRRGRRRLWLL